MPRHQDRSTNTDRHGPDAVIVATSRTAVGRAGKGSFAQERPEDLVAAAVRAALVKVQELDPADITDVIIGCGFPQGKLGMNVARRVALLAGLPATVPGTTVNRFCASSLQAIRIAAHAIRAGEGDVFVAGGVESLSTVNGYPQEEDRHPQLMGIGPLPNAYVQMGLTAENVARRYGVERADMDRFAQRSQERAVAAQRAGVFAREIIPFETAAGSVVTADDGPRPSSTLEALQGLEPAFLEDGTVTAGNSCALNDGGAAVIVMREDLARQRGIAPLARIVSSAVCGVAPELMGIGPIEAAREALARAGMTIADVDVVELNEAFAAQVLPVCDALGIDPFGERLNPYGGAIALGHPFGMTGARIMCTLLNGLALRDQAVGLEMMCVGGGQGMAMVVERLT
jgi:acetyl-CoA C-acetyltransferase